MDKLHYIKQLFKGNDNPFFMFENSDKDKLVSKYQISTI